MPRNGSVALGEIVGRLETLMPELLAKISGDCPKRQAGELHDPCRARMPDLARLKI